MSARDQPPTGPPLLLVRDRKAWRSWLARYGHRVREVWLVQFRKGAAGTAVRYEEALDEALCHGWIDSLVRRLDGERYLRKFTPRTNPRQWSARNARRMDRLIAGGLATKAGIAVAGYRRSPGATLEPVRFSESFPVDLARGLRRNRKAWAYFESLPPSHRRRYVGWVTSAKRPETRLKRLAEAERLLQRGERLGLK